jgi:hypothetical protein
MADDLKMCWGCGKWFPRTKTNFQRNPASHDGFDARCKNCRKIYQQERGYAKIKAEKRRRLCNIVFFENPFPDDIEVDFHHFNKLLMIPIPRITHQFIAGPSKYLNNHFEFNKKWIEKIYCLNLDELLSDNKNPQKKLYEFQSFRTCKYRYKENNKYYCKNSNRRCIRLFKNIDDILKCPNRHKKNKNALK